MIFKKILQKEPKLYNLQMIKLKHLLDILKKLKLNYMYSKMNYFQHKQN